MKGRWAAPLWCHIFWVAGLPLLMLSFSARAFSLCDYHKLWLLAQ